MSKFRTCFFALLGLILMSGLLTAQAPTGKIVGTITDDEGIPLPGVTVEASSPKMIGKSSVITDENGVYRIFALPSGQYTIKYTLEGFNTVIRKDIFILVEQTITVDIEMTPGAIEEEITVLGRSPLVDVKSTYKGMIISKKMFQMLPRGRNFDTLVTIVAGVNYEPWLGTTSQGVHHGTSIDGASDAENMYFIDGLDTTNMMVGMSGQNAVVEFIEEVQFKASGYQAEHGGSLGGVISVITRAGGNEFHGEAIGYLTPSWLHVKERDTLRQKPFDVSEAEYVNYEDLYGKDDWDRYEVGLSIGGYIIPDRLWFFGSFLPRFEKTTRHVEWLTEGYLPSDHVEERTWWNAQAKLTAMPIEGLRITASFINDYYKWLGELPARDGSGNAEKEWSTYGYDYPGFSVSGSVDYTIGSNLMLSARGGYFRTNTVQLKGPPGTRHYFTEEITYNPTTNAGIPGADAYGIRPAYWAEYGYYDGYATKFNIQERFMGGIDGTYYLDLGGEHAVKTGFQWIRLAHDIEDAYAYPPVYLGWGVTYRSKFSPVVSTGEYGYYGIRNPLGTVAKIHSTRLSIYLQDSWTPTFLDSKLTINFGVRLESEDIPSYSDLPEFADSPIHFKWGDKIAPRIGLIYDVFGDASFKIFGSYGKFYDVMKLHMAEGTYGGMKWHTHFHNLDTLDWESITWDNPGGAFLEEIDWRKPSFDTTDTGIKAMSQTEVQVGAEKKIVENIAASVRVVYKRMDRAIEDIGVVTPTGEQYFIANPGYGWTLPEAQGGKFNDKFPACPKAQRTYWAVNLGVDKRFSNNWMAGFHYTWSRLWGNYSGLGSSDEYGRTSPNVERYFDIWFLGFDQNLDEAVGLLQTDKTHFVKAYASYVFDFGLTFGLSTSISSGKPISRELQLNDMQGYYPLGRFTDGRTPMTWRSALYAEYNLKLSDIFTLQLNANVYNLLNNKAAQRVYSWIMLESATLTDDELLATFDYEQVVQDLELTPDPRFLKEANFLEGTRVMLGVKLIF